MDIISKFNLPKYVRKKSFAEASALIAKKFEGRTDPESIATLNDLQGRLQAAQEYVKSEQAKMQKPYPGDKAIQEGVAKHESNQMDLGGALSMIKGGAGAAGTLAGMLGGAFGPTGVDTTGASGVPKKVDGVGAAASGATQGAMAGSSFGPWGAAIGGVVGGGLGLLGASKKNDDITQAQAVSDSSANYQATKMEDGGELNTDPKPNNTIETAAKKVFFEMPDDKDAEDYEDRLALWGKKMNMTDAELQGFVQQRDYDKQYISDREKSFGESFSAWRDGYTGTTPNSKLTQSDEVYQKFWEDTRSKYSQENPRQVNDLVLGYQNRMEIGGGLDTEPDPDKISIEPKKPVYSVNPQRHLNSYAALYSGRDLAQNVDYLNEPGLALQKFQSPTAPESLNPFSKGLDYSYDIDLENLDKGVQNMLGDRSDARKAALDAAKALNPAFGFSPGMTTGSSKEKEVLPPDVDGRAAAINLANMLNNNNSSVQTPGVMPVTSSSVAATNSAVQKESSSPTVSDGASDGDNDRAFNPAELLRYSPIAANFAQVGMLKKPQEVRLDRNNAKYKRNRVDERGMQNTVSQSTRNMQNQLRNVTGGSGAASRASLLASQLTGAKALSSAYNNAVRENNQDDRFGQQFDNRNTMLNIQQGNMEKNINLQRDAAYETNRSQLLAALGDNLGGVGREEMFKRFPELMGLSYDWKGKKV